MGMQELCADAFQEAQEVGVPQCRRVGGMWGGGLPLSTVLWESPISDPHGNIQRQSPRGAELR